jgi:ATP-binding cassette, subfamily B, bacterial MsbA
MTARYGLLLRLLGYLQPHWVALTVGITLAAVVSGAQALIAWLIKPVMDDIFVKHDTRMLTLIPLAVLGAYIVKGVARYGQSYLMASVGERVVATLRHELYRHLQGMSLGFFTSVHSGELVARTITDVNRVARLASIILVNSFRDVWMVVALLAVMFFREWTLALIAATIFPFVAVTIRALSRQLYKINRRTQERTAELSVVLQESFTGIKIIKAFGREDLAQARFDGVNNRLLRLALKDARLDQLSGPLMEILGALGIMGALWYGGFRVVSGALTPGEFFSFTAAVFLLYQPVRQISRSVNGVQQSMGSVERVFEILDMAPTVVDAPHVAVLNEFRDRIVFDHVSFRYPAADAAALSDVCLTVSKGETVALVGLSGGGKTTLTDLLLRFHDVGAGRISIDGRDIREVSVASLRRLMGVVTQGTFLFQDTIERNIAFGKLGATRDEVERAARAAQAHEFITAMPQGYATLVGERGVNLSGGQRQRIAVARAFLRNPPILVLDEATSELDAESEFLVQQALVGLMTGRTVLIVAHRLATIRNADRVVVMQDGRVVEEGRHHELLVRDDSVYRRLAVLQGLDGTQA